jgi:quercetin dioxygenase-like cupin family protein
VADARRCTTNDFDETFYVLAGELTFQFGDDMSTRRGGETAFVPGADTHTYANLSGHAGPAA